MKSLNEEMAEAVAEGMADLRSRFFREKARYELIDGPARGEKAQFAGDDLARALSALTDCDMLRVRYYRLALASAAVVMVA